MVVYGSQVQVLSLDADKDQVKAVAVCSHPAEIWSLAASPSNPAHFATAYQEGARFSNCLGGQ